MTIILHTKGPAAWRQAIELHRKGHADALLGLLARGGPVPAVGRAYLAELVKATTPSRVGRPPMAVGAVWKQWQMADRYRWALAAALAEDAAGIKSKYTAIDRAFLCAMAAFGVSRSTIKRAVDRFR